MVRSSLPQLFGDEDAAEMTENLGAALPEWTEDSFAGHPDERRRRARREPVRPRRGELHGRRGVRLVAGGRLPGRPRPGGRDTSDVAIAGGVDAIQNPFAYLCFSKTQALSPTGRCRPFDATRRRHRHQPKASPRVVLKRLDDAERDGDRIYAVIKGVGGSSDGRDRSLTAPRPEGQMRALRRAYAQAGLLAGHRRPGRGARHRDGRGDKPRPAR